LGRTIAVILDAKPGLDTDRGMELMESWLFSILVRDRVVQLMPTSTAGSGNSVNLMDLLQGQGEDKRARLRAWRLLLST
jgi:hypothetical protein